MDEMVVSDLTLFDEYDMGTQGYIATFLPLSARPC